jgi:hypothetical protein
MRMRRGAGRGLGKERRIRVLNWTDPLGLGLGFG